MTISLPLTSRQQVFTDQYRTLFQANSAAFGLVQKFEAIGGISRANPTGNLTAQQQRDYDQAKQGHLTAHSELTAYLRDSSSYYSRLANEFDYRSRDTRLSLTERNYAAKNAQYYIDLSSGLQGQVSHFP